jgi:dolichyl-diphosphooligosaccharide--protein glycosyltransferase
MAEKARKAGAVEADESKTASFISRIRPTHRRALEIGVLGAVLIIAALFRIMPLKWGTYYTAYDPFLMYRASEYVAKNGYAAWWSWHDTLSWYPMGRDIPHTVYAGEPFSVVFLYQLANAVGFRISVYDTGLWFPVLMACLTCLAAYFVGKDLKDNSTGLLAAFLMAVSPAFIARTMIGHFDTETIGVFGMVATSLFFLRSLKKERPLLHRLACSALAGLSLGYVIISWGAEKYLVGLLALFVIVAMLTNTYDRNYIASYSLTLGVGYLITAVFPHPGVESILSIENLVAIGVVPLMLLYELLKLKMDPRRIRLTMLGVIALFGVGMLVIFNLGVTVPLAQKYVRIISRFLIPSAMFETVAEHQLPTWTTFFMDFGIVLALALMGIYFAMKKMDDMKLYLLVALLTSLYFTANLTRIDIILAFPVSLLAAYGIVELLRPFAAVSVAPAALDRRRRRRKEVFGVSREFSVIFTIFILLTLLPNILLFTSGTSSVPSTFGSSGIENRLISGHYFQDWPHALAWLKENVSSSSVVAAWWDYGYWIEAMANKTTLADGATQNPYQLKDLARMMMLPHNESLLLMQKYDVDYVIVFITYDPTSQQLWGYGDEGKWQAMAQIGGFNVTTFYEKDPSTGSYRYSSAYTNSTLARLMFGTASPNHFKLEYASDYGFVLIYKVEY